MKRIVDISEMLIAVDKIEGWLTQLEQLALLQLPFLVDHLPGELVEIGSYKGKSTIALGLGSCLLSSQRRPIYAIDPFEPEGIFYKDHYFNDFTANVIKNNLENKVIPIKKYSTEAYDDCPQTIAALFIDGDHEYHHVKHDIIHYVPRIVPGGIVAFHDYDNIRPGLIKAVGEMLDEDSKFKSIALYDSLLLVQKQ